MAQLGGAAALILAQVTALLVSLWPNAATARLARIRASGHDKAAGAAVEADDDPWWKDALVLMLGAYTFLIIMVKTTLEYEYNVIVSETSTTEEEKGAKFPTSKAPISAVSHSFWLIFGRAIISRNGLEAWMLFFGTRARGTLTLKRR